MLSCLWTLASRIGTVLRPNLEEIPIYLSLPRGKFSITQKAVKISEALRAHPVARPQSKGCMGKLRFSTYPKKVQMLRPKSTYVGTSLGPKHIPCTWTPWNVILRNSRLRGSEAESLEFGGEGLSWPFENNFRTPISQHGI